MRRPRRGTIVNSRRLASAKSGQPEFPLDHWSRRGWESNEKGLEAFGRQPLPGSRQVSSTSAGCTSRPIPARA